ncbi:hypothetical protein [Phytomonospora endophytica]|uniref:Arsenate reductase n=1 Tax=Phytomonospora endophytica TaxID=714109 RepID=A0A841FAT9_9ACTN|nr:hypothetical protein [Phytomonospora endophytica]MBB6034381.1 hypothetical protein [Phytomonospora endophytica]GIG66774.1 hypothetical protein Pen01_30690 [Phytomonospora endophytica]
MSLDWVPDACTLPTAERPARLAEFDGLFAAHLTATALDAPTRARITLSGDTGLPARVGELAARESSCCSFLTFTVTPTSTGADLDIEVPGAHSGVLAALVARAEAVIRP